MRPAVRHEPRRNPLSLTGGTASVGVLLVVLAGGCARKKAAVALSPVERGRATYAQLCATCHGVAGNGYVADNAPSLRSPTFLATATNAFLEAAILRGRPG